jgi:hypothetical protein
LQAELQTKERQIVAGLERSHEAELTRRQAAADAMARWAQNPAGHQRDEPPSVHELHRDGLDD